ncbi:MAG: hypothetical protein ACYSSK_07675 [Planctomycetota bacterium]|jgi:hypothetical protein
MELEESVEVNTGPSTDRLFRYLGLSIFYYYLILLLSSIIEYFFTKEFTWNLSYLLYFWIAYAVKDGSRTACKWGIFCMSLNAVAIIVFCFIMLVNPAFITFENNLSSAALPVYFVGSIIYLGWSLVNLKLLVRLLKLYQIRFWTKAPIVGYGMIICLFIGFLGVPFMINYSQGYSNSDIQKKYADVIEYLNKVARHEVSTSTNSPQVLAISETYPEVLSASIYSSKHSSLRIISKKKKFSSTSYWGSRATRTNSNGDKIRYIVYDDFVKDNDNKWVKIELCIEPKSN